eukprot:TRINITY_DN59348_c0_g1_i4.p1 TRINITY_DN59348_c0_g1~~TRINITY_DN59348_c0_g1_i4.p1  ORF type:complete len:402 (-),score=64.68 TRINITY_DN59348_c0_g1_i4:64-1269(-)
MADFGSLSQNCLALQCMNLSAADICHLEATSKQFQQTSEQADSLKILEAATREAVRALLGCAEEVEQLTTSCRPLWAVAAPSLQELRAAGILTQTTREILLSALLGRVAPSSQLCSNDPEVFGRCLQLAAERVRCSICSWAEYIFGAAASLDDAGEYTAALSLMDTLAAVAERQRPGDDVRDLTRRVLMSRAVYRVNAIQTQVLKAEEDRLITQEAYDDVVKAFQISSGLCGKINERGGDGTLYRVEDGVTLERDDKALIAAAHTSLVYGRVSAALGKEIAESEAGGPSLRKRLAAAGVLFDNAASALHLSQKMFSYCRLSEEVLWTNVCLGDLDYCRFRGIEDTAAIITSRDFVQKAVDAYTAEGRPDSPQAAFAMGHLGRVFLGLQSTDTLMAMYGVSL